jgi:hypothetical protein
VAFGQAEVFKFQEGCYSAAADGQAWDKNFVNVWNMAFSPDGFKLAAEVRGPLAGLVGAVLSVVKHEKRGEVAEAEVSTAATNQSRWRRKSRPSQRIFLSEDRFFVRPARTASSSRPAVSTAVARGGGQGGPKGTA